MSGLFDLSSACGRGVRLSVAAAALSVACFGIARAQDKPAWFVPSAPKAEAPAPARSRPVRGAPAPVAAPAMADDQGLGDQSGGDQQPDQGDDVPQYNLPALSPLPPLPKTASPPNAVIGVLGVPDVMRASTAAQMVQKVIGARRDKLAQDFQKEQQVWRDTQQALVNQRGTLTQDQLQTREKALQDRVSAATKTFRARNRVIQEAAQISLAQVERVLVAVIRQVAESRGMNLVLHRQQVALNISDFDITDQVTAQLNSLLPSVVIPPDGQEPTPANTGGVLVPGATSPAPAAGQ